VPNTVDAKDFLPHPTLLTLGDVAKDSQGWMVETTASSAAACPDCGGSLDIPAQQLFAYVD